MVPNVNFLHGKQLLNFMGLKELWIPLINHERILLYDYIYVLLKLYANQCDMLSFVTECDDKRIISALQMEDIWIL